MGGTDRPHGPERRTPFRLHQGTPGIAPCQEETRQFVPIQGIAYGDGPQGGGEAFPGDQSLGQGRGGRDDQGGGVVQEAAEGLDPGQLAFTLEGEHVRGNPIPGGKVEGLSRAEKEDGVPMEGPGLFFRGQTRTVVRHRSLKAAHAQRPLADREGRGRGWVSSPFVPPGPCPERILPVPAAVNPSRFPAHDQPIRTIRSRARRAGTRRDSGTVMTVRFSVRELRMSSRVVYFMV